MQQFISKLKKTSIVLSFVICLPTLLLAQTKSIQTELETYYNQNIFLKPSIVGISVVDVKNDSVLVAMNAEKSMLPASIVKLYTTGAALHYLGAEFTYKTYITYSGSIDEKGVLNGNIYIHGSGDPTTGSKYFPETKGFLDTIVNKILAYGIKSVTGKLIIDCSIFDSQAIPTSWVYEDLGKSYAAGVYPAAINDNTFSISFSNPSDGKKVNKITPNEAPAVSISPYEQSSIDDSVSMDGSRGSFIVKGAIPSPQEIIGLELFQRFVDKGLFSYKQDFMPVVIPIREDLDTIGYVESPYLKEIIYEVNQLSLNNFAEHLCKYLGYYVYNDGSYTKGTVAVKAFFDTLGLASKNVDLFDGSGLSRFNVTSPLHMSSYLSKMYKRGGKDSEFYKSLSVSNVSGTLQTYLFPKEMKGKVYGKTGSMTRVRNVAGYITTQSGNVVAFTIMINGISCSTADAKKTVVDMLKIIYLNY